MSPGDATSPISAGTVCYIVDMEPLVNDGTFVTTLSGPLPCPECGMSDPVHEVTRPDTALLGGEAKWLLHHLAVGGYAPPDTIIVHRACLRPLRGAPIEVASSTSKREFEHDPY